VKEFNAGEIDGGTPHAVSTPTEHNNSHNADRMQNPKTELDRSSTILQFQLVRNSYQSNPFQSTLSFPAWTSQLLASRYVSQH